MGKLLIGLVLILSAPTFAAETCSKVNVLTVTDNLVVGLENGQIVTIKASDKGFTSKLTLITTAFSSGMEVCIDKQAHDNNDRKNQAVTIRY